MRTKLFLIISLLVLMVGGTLSFANAPSEKNSAAKEKAVIAKAAAVKTAYLNGCRELHFDQNPMDSGMLSTYQPFSVLTPIDIKAGEVTMPFFLTSKSGQFPTETSQIWDIEFFDAVPPSGYYPNPDSANQNADEFHDGTPAAWPNKNHSSLVARSTKQTPDIPDATDGPGSYIALTGDLGSVTLSRDVHYVRARLRADIFPDNTHNSVRARTVTFCAGPPPVDPYCQNFELDQNGVTPAWDGSEGYSDGILRYDSNPARNSKYSNTVSIDLPAGKVMIPNIYTFDENRNRENEIQDSERVSLEFLDSSGAVIVKSDTTPDLADNVFSAYYEGDINDVTLDRPAKSVRAVHQPNASSNQNTSDALVVAGATICYNGTPPTYPTTEANPEAKIELINPPLFLYEEETGAFNVKVTNTGNVPLTGMSIASIENKNILNPVPTLNPGDSFEKTFYVTLPLGQVLPSNNKFTYSAFIFNPRYTIDSTKYHWPSRWNIPADEPVFFQRTVSQDVTGKRIILPS